MWYRPLSESLNGIILEIVSILHTHGMVSNGIYTFVVH